MKTTTLTKKEKDKLKKKQDQLEDCLEILGIDENEFYMLFRDDPDRVRILLNLSIKDLF